MDLRPTIVLTAAGDVPINHDVRYVNAIGAELACHDLGECT
jgi:hypothetical protein